MGASDHSEQGEVIGRHLTHRRTIFDADIAAFVNVTGLHEPPFIDMEYVKTEMPPSHHRRFAPAPFFISLGMGLVAPLLLKIFDEIRQVENIGLMMGMVGVDARVKAPVYPGDTLQVELFSRIRGKTSKGNILVGLQHVLRNQDNIVVADFEEKILFSPDK